MTLLADPWWLPSVLAAAVALDAVLSIRPPRFIRDCLDGVRFPRDWWWTLVVIKTLAVAGLLVGLVVPGVGLAATVGSEFWLNCLGFHALALATLVFGYLV